MNRLHAHFIGIGGVSQSKLALMLKSFGYEVSGSDREESKQLNLLRAAGIKAFAQHKAENLKQNPPDFVVYNGAIKEDNIELKTAKQLGIKLIKRSVMLSRIAKMHKTCIAVCGSHGKTTTTALLGSALAHLKPQLHVGGDLTGKAFEVSEKKDLFITEACEFQKSLLEIEPDIAIMLNIDADHMDCYKNIDDIEATFLKFALATKKMLIFNNQDKRAKRISQKCAAIHPQLKQISFGKGGDVEAKKVKQTADGLSFVVFYKKKPVSKIDIKLYGMHNVLNVLAACAACIALSQNKFKEHLKNFAGVERRMQFLGELKGNTVIHDYAHHPAEISATIRACKKHFKKNIIVVFEPHTYSRTKALWNDFISCFKEAQRSYILPIYSAREKPIENITSANLAREIKNCSFIKEKELKEELNKFSKSIILVLGAGSIEKIAHRLILS